MPCVVDCAPFSCKWARLSSPTISSNQFRWSLRIKKTNGSGTHICFKERNAGVRIPRCYSEKPWTKETLVGQNENADTAIAVSSEHEEYNVRSFSVGRPSVPPLSSVAAADQAFVLLSIVACTQDSIAKKILVSIQIETTTVAFVSFIVTAIPTLNAMRRAALSLEKLADAAREELPGTMAAVRLSGMEISDLTVELSDLSQEISDGVRKSAQAVQAAEVEIRRLGVFASSKAITLLEERANLPIVNMKPVVASAAETTSLVVQRARRALMHIISMSRSPSSTRENRSETL